MWAEVKVGGGTILACRPRPKPHCPTRALRPYRHARPPFIPPLSRRNITNEELGLDSRRCWGEAVYRISDLRSRDVIDVGSGKRLGFVEDVELDPTDGRIIALVVPGSTRFLGFFGRDQDYVIPWDLVVKVGEDVILVHLPGQRQRLFRRGELHNDA